MINDIVPWLGGALLLTNIYTGVSSWSKGKDINTLGEQVEKLKAENAVCRSNVNTHLASIERQNAIILANAADLNASEERWNKRVPMVEYVEKWRTKYVDRNNTIIIKEEDCAEILLTLDAIRNGGF